MANPNTDDEQREKTPTQLSEMLSEMLPPKFTFWFGALMAIISIAVIIVRTTAVLSAGVTAYNIYHLGILPAAEDISKFIPVVSLSLALTIHARRLRMTMADYIEGLTKKRREKDVKKGEAIGISRTKDWYERKFEAERKGEPFNEPFPGDEESHDRQ